VLSDVQVDGQLELGHALLIVHRRAALEALCTGHGTEARTRV
jgi:hypothetical protein